MSASAQGSTLFSRLAQRPQWLVVVVLLLLLFAGTVGYLLHGGNGAVGGDAALPSTVPLPAHPTLTRAEHFVVDQTFNWYYSVPTMDDETISAFYRTQLPRHGWQCVMAMKSLNSTLYGKQFTASSIYITAFNHGTKLQLYTAGGDYGAYLLEDDVPDDAVALKISLEPAQDATCPGTPTP
ncbi:MAG: hypothetical protein H0X24_13900 [Ktedonobacterales bacterium]|nr:hypothetical protein [Ktedonobacterales bacterium]